MAHEGRVPLDGARRVRRLGRSAGGRPQADQDPGGCGHSGGGAAARLRGLPLRRHQGEPMVVDAADADHLPPVGDRVRHRAADGDVRRVDEVAGAGGRPRVRPVYVLAPRRLLVCRPHPGGAGNSEHGLRARGDLVDRQRPDRQNLVHLPRCADPVRCGRAADRAGLALVGPRRTAAFHGDLDRRRRDGGDRRLRDALERCGGRPDDLQEPARIRGIRVDSRRP